MDMPPFKNQQTPDEPTTNQWFRNIEAGTPLVVTPPPRSSPNLKRRILIAAVAVVVILGGSAATLSAFGVDMFSTAPPCLTKDDYKQLTGKDADSQLSPQSFYTVSFNFTNGTSKFIGDSKTNADEQAKKIGQFYALHASDRSIIITISSDADQGDTEQAAIARIDSLKQLLIKEGVAESAIQLLKPSKLADDGELSEGSAELSSAKAYINVASIATCR